MWQVTLSKLPSLGFTVTFDEFPPSLEISVSVLITSAQLQGLCHHDLSPENVVISGQGSAAVVMDMGMVQRIPIGDGGEPAPMRDRERFGKLR